MKLVEQIAEFQAEIREFRARFVDNNLPSSGWCAVVKVTVSPQG